MDALHQQQERIRLLKDLLAEAQRALGIAEAQRNTLRGSPLSPPLRNLPAKPGRRVEVRIDGELPHVRTRRARPALDALEYVMRHGDPGERLDAAHRYLDWLEGG